jgi:hypothetical protein
MEAFLRPFGGIGRVRGFCGDFKEMARRDVKIEDVPDPDAALRRSHSLSVTAAAESV